MKKSQLKRKNSKKNNKKNTKKTIKKNTNTNTNKTTKVNNMKTNIKNINLTRSLKLDKSKKIKKLKVKKILNDEEMKSKEGHFFSKKHFKTIINSDCDVFIGDNLLLSFRKNVINKKICCQAWEALHKEAQKKHNNRGAAAGLLDTSKLPGYVNKTTRSQKFRTYYTGKDGTEKKDHLSNSVSSGIIGYYDKPDRNDFQPSNINYLSNKKKKKLLTLYLKKSKKASKMPCRLTKFTKKETKKWKNSIPLIVEADKQFKKLVPDRHQAQLKQAKDTPNFQIENTAFSTVTLNYNFRTATHRDKGDLPEGFGNLLVLEKSECDSKNSKPFKGGVLGFPQYGVAVDVRQGDFLAMDVHQWHCNTPLEHSKKTIEKDEIGRLSIVCYLRKNMIKCKAQKGKKSKKNK